MKTNCLLATLVCAAVGGYMYFSSQQLVSGKEYEVTKLYNNYEQKITENKQDAVIQSASKTPSRILANISSDEGYDVVRMHKSMDAGLPEPVAVQERYAIDMNGNEIAIQFTPEAGENGGMNNEFGEGVAAEFEPKATVLGDSSLLAYQEENRLSNIGVDFANSVLLEESSRKNEANPIPSKSHRIESQQEEGSEKSFFP